MNKESLKSNIEILMYEQNEILKKHNELMGNLLLLVINKELSK